MSENEKHIKSALIHLLKDSLDQKEAFGVLLNMVLKNSPDISTADKSALRALTVASRRDIAKIRKHLDAMEQS